FRDPQKARDYLKGSVFPIVIKADGEAAGKGVVVAQDYAEADAAIHRMMEKRVFGASGETVVIEECLFGQEISVMAFVDGETVVPMVGVQDHKRIGEGDTGSNTGGMGAYAPVPIATPELVEDIKVRILQPAVHAVRETGIPYRGILYAGVMVTASGPYCMEFNARFGDPETQVVLPLLETDLADILNAAVDVELDRLPVTFSERAAVCVVLSSAGYPETSDNGRVITGLESAEKLDAVAVFHAGTASDDAGRIITAGGRVLGVTATGEDFREARERCYAAVSRISFQGAYYRRDIGHHALSVAG
ncbi:MAG: phosphoribosylamine--glycine ligase, partial [Capsulimonadales bacterium]|nr:phosphoribosylamine--glycine ligase [Capsulimonadales bacterium]